MSLLHTNRMKWVDAKMTKQGYHIQCKNNKLNKNLNKKVINSISRVKKNLGTIDE